jgi:membrane protease YdiL (CAAX protease family)
MRKNIMNFLGYGKPFATSPGYSLIAIPLAIIYFWKIMPWLDAASRDFFDPSVYAGYKFLIAFAPQAFILAAVFFLQKRLFSDLAFVGGFNRKDMLFGLCAITAIYTAAYAFTFLTGQPREPAMQALYLFKTPSQIFLMIGVLLLLPPIVEELLFRHVALSILPFHSGKVIAVLASLVSAVFFTLMHLHYEYLSTIILIFFVGLILCVARIKSQGLLLPMVLHSYAIAIGLTFDALSTQVK